MYASTLSTTALETAFYDGVWRMKVQLGDRVWVLIRNRPTHLFLPYHLDVIEEIPIRPQNLYDRP
jgi:hypothetical protein